MSLTRDESALMDKRDDLTENERSVIDCAMHELNRAARASGLRIRTDDAQCRVEAAMIRLVLESRP